MRFILTAGSILIVQFLGAQELFVFTEPASNMAKGGIGVRISNAFMKEDFTKRIDYHLVPEVMAGISKKIMIHAEAFISNMSTDLKAEGGGLYLKYRFFSIDEVHSHFRMALFGRYAFNNAHIHEPAIDLQGHNSGYEAGLVSTKLINKVAVSAIISALHVNDNGKQKFGFGSKNRNAFNYSLSAGKLMLPKEYTSYGQTNLNLMLEFLGQINSQTGDGYLDAAPSIQFIINSRIRIDAGYRFAINEKLYRSAPSGAVFKFEYNFYNVIK